MGLQVGIYQLYPFGAHDHSTIEEGGSIPLSSILGHTKAPHDALAIDADKVDGEEAAAIVTNARVKAHFPDLIANILSDHNKAGHDALGLDHAQLSNIVTCICKANLGTNQSIPQNAITKILFDNLSFDVGDNFNIGDSTFIIPATDKYLLTVHLVFLSVDPDVSIKIYLYKNDVAYKTSQCWRMTSAAPCSPSMTIIREFTLNDILDIRVKHSSAAAKDLLATETFFCISRIGK